MIRPFGLGVRKDVKTMESTVQSRSAGNQSSARVPRKHLDFVSDGLEYETSHEVVNPLGEVCQGGKFASSTRSLHSSFQAGFKFAGQPG
jgi:hypothetical protein